MKTSASIVSIALVACLLTACTTSENQDIGIAAGAVVGGLAGHALTGGSTAGTIAGAVGGGLLGNEVAK